MNNNYQKIFLVVILFFAIAFSLSHLTTRPKLWFDEGVTIEIAHNFLLFKKLDISTAPGVFSGLPYDVGTNGYPLTIPLSGIFYIFNFGLVQSRLYMIFWLVAALLSLYYLVRSVFGIKPAMVATAFIATFAPFYGDGLTVTGEIPGFFFLIWGLFFLIRALKQGVLHNPDNYFFIGLFFALAGVSKPAVYLPLFPAFLIFLLLQERKRFFSKLIRFISGSVPAFLLWIWLAFPEPLLRSTWQKAVLYYRYPYGTDYSVWQSVLKNISLVPNHSTLIYFTLLTSIIICWFFISARADILKKKLVVFFLVYGAFAFFYFLESPGWLRYIIGFQLLAFIFVFPSLVEISKRIFKKERIQRTAVLGVLVILLAFQTFHLFFLRSDLYSPYPEKVANFINNQLARNQDYKVGILNSPDIASLIHPLKKFHVVRTCLGGLSYGRNPLSFSQESLPQFIAFRGENDFVKEYKSVLEDNYLLIKDLGGYSVYELK